MIIENRQDAWDNFIETTSYIYGSSKELGIYAMASAVNDLAARGGSVKAIKAQILIPDYAYKSRINTTRKLMTKAAKAWEIPQIEVTGTLSPAVRLPMIQVAACGLVPRAGAASATGREGAALNQRVPDKEAPDKVASTRESSVKETSDKKASDKKASDKKAAPAGRDIVLTKWIGMEGMLRIVNEREAELLERFTPAFVNQMKAYKDQLLALREIDVAKAMGVSVIRQVAEGGILAALWNLALEMECGLTVDLKSLSVRQETIEVCEHYRLNPYQLTSTGTLLMVTDQGDTLADALNNEGIQAAVIGRLTDSNDKIILNGEETRYIDRPAPDEIGKIFEEKEEGR